MLERTIILIKYLISVQEPLSLHNDISRVFYKSAGEAKSNLDLRLSRVTDNCPEDDLCKEDERGLELSDLDFFTLLPPDAGCFPFNDDTDITTSVDTPSCSVKYENQFKDVFFF